MRKRITSQRRASTTRAPMSCEREKRKFTGFRFQVSGLNVRSVSLTLVPVKSITSWATSLWLLGRDKLLTSNRW